MPIPRVLACCVLGASLLFGGCGTTGDGILPTVNAQLRAHPGMQVEDLYKVVHQAAFGNGHLITDTASVLEYLLAELDEVETDTAEPLIESVSPDEAVVRVNLRPFKARGGDPQQLFDAMLASAQHFRPQPALFERWWEEIVDGASRGTIPVDPAALREFGAAKKAEGYPAIHHSAAYEARYHPAYRVVLRESIAPAVGRQPARLIDPGGVLVVLSSGQASATTRDRAASRNGTMACYLTAIFAFWRRTA